MRHSSSITTVLIILSFTLRAGLCLGDIRLPSLIGNNMVLQRNAPITLWGWSDPNEKIKIRLNGKDTVVRADSQGQWIAILHAMPEGGPYDVIFRGKNRIVLRNILVGDVWVASGQSNMEFRVKAKGSWMTGVNDAEQEILSAHYPNIRLITMDHSVALEPQPQSSSDGWRVVTPEVAGDSSAVAYLFARELHQHYKIPIGIVESDRGNTRIEAWMSNDALSKVPNFSTNKIDISAKAAFGQYQAQWRKWHQKHGEQDRGRIHGQDIWATPNLDESGWTPIQIPRPDEAWSKDFGGFDGIVWFRRSITLTSEEEQRDTPIFLGTQITDGELFFNGHKVGDIESGQDNHYVIPAAHVHQGKNVIAVRTIGQHDGSNANESGVGIFSTENSLYLKTDVRRLFLAGTWLTKPGPDLADYPVATVELASIRPTSKTPTALFNAMINPLINFRIKGVIWYQGEGNTDRPLQYRSLFPALIKDWREKWGYMFPFVFVQIAGFGPDQPESVECKWAELREAQTSALELPEVGMASAVDLGDAADVHPRDKQDVAHRLALVAERVAYGENVISSGPRYRSMRIEANKLRLQFSDLGGGLQVNDKYGYLRGFELAGADGNFHWAQAQVDGSDILVSASAVTHPAAARYDWSNTPDGNIFNKEGLPAIPFRTNVPDDPEVSGQDSRYDHGYTTAADARYRDK